ncbi:DNA methyltransferase-2 [Operophtera brumata]|uniref:DNA methyltransferase-2 n=1 Tax=Operophtera brumata TaxID=104452 RepID=A0A0L7L4U9_OPEBR|nr:DNA methyltransferase-2 [Operophtera brumata]
MVYNILELYSGIGGMHCAWTESGLPGQIITAVDVNTVANEVYKHNFPDINLICRNIQSLTSKEIEKLDVNVILMSPPCQPFSRNGKYLDNNDPRANSFLYLIGILPELHNIEYILMENVKGFENSTVRNQFVEKLKQCNFIFQEFLLCPMSIGVPNSRLRYYCIAQKNNSSWNFKRKDDIMLSLPKDYEEPYSINSILETDVPEKYLVPQKLLKRANIFDICHRDSRRSCCFTKAYSHYIEGAGSFYTDASPATIKETIEKANSYELGNDEFIHTISELKLRYFTPKEVLALMTFPKTYSLPKTVTTKQCYSISM